MSDERELAERAATRHGHRSWDVVRVERTHVILLAVAWVVLASTLIGVGELVAHSSPIQGFDNHVTSTVVAHRSAALDSTMKAVTWIGSWVAIVVTTAAAVFLVIRRKLPVGFFVLALAVWAGTQGATTLAKLVVQRPRPPVDQRLVTAHGWSWPSGHTTTAALVFAVASGIVWMLTSNSGLRRLAILIWIVAVASVGFSRIELGVHWTTDVMASVAFMAAWLASAGALAGPHVRHWLETAHPTRSTVGPRR